MYVCQDLWKRKSCKSFSESSPICRRSIHWEEAYKSPSRWHVGKLQSQNMLRMPKMPNVNKRVFVPNACSLFMNQTFTHSEHTCTLDLLTFWNSKYVINNFQHISCTYFLCIYFTEVVTSVFSFYPISYTPLNSIKQFGRPGTHKLHQQLNKDPNILF